MKEQIPRCIILLPSYLPQKTLYLSFPPFEETHNGELYFKNLFVILSQGAYPPFSRGSFPFLLNSPPRENPPFFLIKMRTLSFPFRFVFSSLFGIFPHFLPPGDLAFKTKKFLPRLDFFVPYKGRTFFCVCSPCAE